MSIKEISREEFASYILQSPCSKDDSLRVQDSFGSEAEYCASRNYIHGPLPKEPVPPVIKIVLFFKTRPRSNAINLKIS